jgi:heavy metal sensor kinase
VFARSPALLDGDLERIAGTVDAPAVRTVTFPDGRPGRIVGMTFVPRHEYENGQANPPMKVTLVVGRDIVRLQATLTQMRGILIGVCVIAVVLSAGVLALVVRRSLRPVGRLSRQIAGVGEEDLSVRIDAAGISKELSPVVDRLNDLLVRLGAAFQRERRFTGDVAHELRTPLAGLRARLELALSRDREPQAYRDTARSCLEISLHLQRMVENLLHLARADAGQLEIRHESVDLSEVIRECWQPLEESARARGLRVAWGLSAPGTVATDRDKLRVIVQNVLDNAVTYANAKGQISVSTSGDDGTIVLAVSNMGSNLSAGDVSRVFDRFWRADPSYRQVEAGHCGLGLPLCKAVIERLGGSIEAAADAAGVFTITIRLPRSGANSCDGPAERRGR